ASCAIGTGGTFNGGVGNLNVLETGVQTSNGYGTTLVVRPSLVTGLFTDTKISTTVPTASADVGVQVCVTIDGKTDGVYPKGCVLGLEHSVLRRSRRCHGYSDESVQAERYAFLLNLPRSRQGSAPGAGRTDRRLILFSFGVNRQQEFGCSIHE